MEYPPVSQTLLIQGDNLSPCIIYRAFLNTGGSYCTMCTLCNGPYHLWQSGNRTQCAQGWHPWDADNWFQKKKNTYVKKGPHLEDRVPIGTFFTFWVPMYLSGSLFSRQFVIFSPQKRSFINTKISNEIFWILPLWKFSEN